MIKPTDAEPGSDEKILVLQKRAESRLPLFHVLDNLLRHSPHVRSSVHVNPELELLVFKQGEDHG